MNRRLPVVGFVVAAVLIGAGVSVLAWLRIREARAFSAPHEVQTEAGTNYVVQLLEATVGRADNGCVLIVYARMQNPNPFMLVLRRDAFVLLDDNKNSCLPSTSGTQEELIKLPPGGVSDREAFSFIVPEKMFQGAIQWQVGRNDRVTVKDSKPYDAQLRSGQFRTFRRRAW